MEALEELTGADVARALGAYRHVLRLHQDAINRLNVYPVPDGDTGTNMALTVEAVVTELAERRRASATWPAAISGPPPATPRPAGGTGHGGGVQGHRPRLAHGGPGELGVILSQLLRGCTGVLAASAEVGPAEVAEALGAPARRPARPCSGRWRERS